jgi:hypothetical protein
MLACVRYFAAVVTPGRAWGQRELGDLERNAELFRARLGH